MPKPLRKRKADTMLHGVTDERDVKCDYAVGPLDALAREMDRKWGVDRLPELVTPELAAKYGAAMAQLNAAIEANDPELCAHKAGVCIRGLRTLDKAAEDAGRKPATGDYLEYDLDGFKFAVLVDEREWPALKAVRPELLVFNLREVAQALKAYADVVPLGEVKNAFPGATVTKFPKPPKPEVDWEKELDDELPF